MKKCIWYRDNQGEFFSLTNPEEVNEICEEMENEGSEYVEMEASACELHEVVEEVMC
jgi:hypothetical protein